jgi:alpha-2-macroglobulin
MCNAPRSVLLLAVCASLLSCGRSPGAGPVPDGRGAAVQEGGVTDTPLLIPPLPLPALPAGPGAPAGPGLEVRLRSVSSVGGPAGPAEPVTPAQALDESRTQALLARLPALPPESAAESFRFPAASPPPPRTGRIELATFPPPAMDDAPRPPPPAEPLRVVRLTPEGPTDLAPHLTITFSEAMVPLTTVAQAESGTVPVRLTPQPPGRWTWLDTRTLRFQPERRLPMATSYTVEVPAGTRSAAGRPLEATARFSVSTPAPRATGGWPAVHPDERDGRQDRRFPGAWPDPRWNPRSVRLDPVIIIAFDQDIDPAAVLRTTRLAADGRALPLRLATPAELAADTLAARIAAGLQDGRWVALRPTQPLPRDAEIQVTVQPGTPSAEGPRTTTQPQTMRFRTYGPLRIASHGCWAEQCRPGMPWQVHFTNPIDSASWSPDGVVVEPELRDMAITLSGGQLQITGDARANTRYRVSLAGGVRDRFGQALEGPRSVVFNIGAPEPALALPGAPLVILDPDGPPRVAVRAWGMSGLRIRVYRVTPLDWPAWADSLARWQRSAMGVLTPPGQLVDSRTVELPGRGSEFAETHVDVSAALAGRFGHAILIVEPAASLPFGLDRLRGRPLLAHAWVQSTEIGLSAAADGEELIVWAGSLRTAATLAGVDVTTLPGGRVARTTADGMARFPLGPAGVSSVVARRGEDSALLPASQWPMPQERGWMQRLQSPELRWYTLTDRGLYRPGETVHLKGWLRRLPGGRSVEPSIPGDIRGIDFTMRGSRGEEVAAGMLTPGDLGGFHAAIELPEALNLGHASVALRPAGPEQEAANQHWHSVQVQEFRRPDYEVRVSADPGPHMVGGIIDVAVRASYFAGGGLAAAPVEWRVRTRAAEYTPPGWARWHFGRARWWLADQPGEDEHVLQGETDGGGNHRLLIDLLSATPPFPSTVQAEAQVHDVTRQAGSGSVALVVHPAVVNVGLRLQRGWLRPGAPAGAEVIVVDHEGAVVAGRPVTVRVERVSASGWPARQVAAGPAWEVCRFASAAEPVPCTFTLDSAGTWRLQADVEDASGRTSRTETMVHVGGASGAPDPRREPGAFEMFADREEYQPGDTARLLVRAPFHPADALVTVRGGGILSTQRVRITSDAHEIAVPITDAHLGGVRVRVDLAAGLEYGHSELGLAVPPRRRALDVTVTLPQTVVAPGDSAAVDVVVRDAQGRPVRNAEVALWMVDEAVLALGGYALPDPLQHFYTGRHGYVQDQQSRRWVLHWPRSAGPGTISGVLLAEHGRSMPGATVRITGTDVSTTTAYDGRFTLRGIPAGEVVLEVVGPDGQTARRTLMVPPEGLHVGNVVLGTGGLAGEGFALAEQAARTVAPLAAAPPPPAPPMIQGRIALDALAVTGQELAGGDPEVELRTDFAPLVFFEPALRTDTEGRVRVQARLPGSLTRYRVSAVAVAGADRFGTGEATLTARKDLLVRILAPRFLHQGDRVELPVLVQNTTASPLPVAVAVRAAGLEVGALRGQQVVLPAGGRAELRFEAAAPQAGTAHLQAIAVSGALSDAAAGSLPVLTPATVEAFAVHGSTAADGAIVLPLARPQGVLAGFGGLEVSLTSTALHSLTDAVLYLHDYPFRGTEHIASRVLAVAALRDVLQAFGAEGLPSPDSVLRAVQRDVADLVARQGGDGGWSFWLAGGRTDPFVSIHAAHALVRARDGGFDVPAMTLQRAARYLESIEAAVGAWPLSARQSAAAYAVYVRHRIGGDTRAVADARRMASAAPARVGGELPVEAAAWLLHVLAQEPAARGDADALRRAIMNRLVETAGTATFAERYEDAAHLLLHSSRRTDAVALEALLATAADDDVASKLAQSLLAHRVAGRWAGTQENVWVLLALDRYFRTYEAAVPAFEARVWLGEQFAGSAAFRGRSTDREEIRVPMPELLRTDARELVIARQGEGRLYYRAGLRYAPADPRVPATDRGFLVSRRYEAVDDPADVRRDSDGTWHVRPGARVRVTLTLMAPSVRFHVALVDPLPGGFEPINPELQGTGFTDDSPRPRDPLPPARGGAPPPPPPPPGMAVSRPALPGTWSPGWFEHQNLRDDRAEAFTSLLRAGSYEYSYLARATTPGTFVVPPPRAEMMYEPETFGRGEGAVVVVGGGGR